MDTAKKHLDPSRSVSGDKGFSRDPRPGGFGMVFGEGRRNSETPDGYVALDIASLSLLVAASASSPTVDPSDEDGDIGDRAPLENKLAKKESQRGGEGTALQSAAAGRERTAAHIDVASEEGSSALFPVKTPTAATRVGSRCRRVSGRRPSPWLRPRRVLVLFASFSSMGTLILLYFTLSMGKMTAGHPNAR